MTFFLLNILLALLFAFLWGSFEIYTLLAGLVVGYVLLGLYGRSLGNNYGRKVSRLIWFFGYFVKILYKSNVVVVKAVLRTRLDLKPRIIRYGVETLTPVQLTTLANLITLTPGTLVIDVSADHKWIYVHCMYAADIASAVNDLDELRDKLLLGVFS